MLQSYIYKNMEINFIVKITFSRKERRDFIVPGERCKKNTQIFYFTILMFEKMAAFQMKFIDLKNYEIFQAK